MLVLALQFSRGESSRVSVKCGRPERRTEEVYGACQGSS